MLDGDLNQRLAGLVVLVVGLVALAHAAADARLAFLWFRAAALPSHLHGHELSSDKCSPKFFPHNCPTMIFILQLIQKHAFKLM